MAGITEFLTNAVTKLIGVPFVEQVSKIGTDFGTGSGKETFGGFLSNVFRKWSGSGLTDSQKQMNEFNASQAQIQRDYEERLSNTAFQRGVADMQSAGLNPALMYGSGSPSSTPSGSAASAASDSGGTLSFGEILQAFALPTQLAQMRANIANTEANTRKTDEDAQRTALDNEFLQSTMAARIRAVDLANNLSEAETKQIHESIPLIQQNLKKSIAETKTEEERAILTKWEAVLTENNAERVASLLPYEKLLLEAQTEQQKASAALSMMQTAYQQKLIDSGFVEAQISQMRAAAAASYAGAELARANAAISEFKDNVMTGKVFAPVVSGPAADKWYGKIANIPSSALNGLVSTLSIVATSIAGPLSGLIK